jgi:hypothetical protein
MIGPRSKATIKSVPRGCPAERGLGQEKPIPLALLPSGDPSGDVRSSRRKWTPAGEPSLFPSGKGSGLQVEAPTVRAGRSTSNRTSFCERVEKALVAITSDHPLSENGENMEQLRNSVTCARVQVSRFGGAIRLLVS